VLLPDAGLADLQLIQQFDTGATIPPLVPGDYSIRLRNSAGTLLADYPFTPEDDEYAAGVFSFGQIVAWVDGTTTIQIVDLTNDAIMTEAPVSANPPQLTNVALQNPPTPVAGTVPLTWVASDPDGDPLTFDLAYSRDAGVTFHPLQVGITGDSTEIDADALGGGLGFFRLTASDGVHLAQATSPVYVVAAKPPQPYILSPGDDAVFQWGQTIHLNGIAYDLQDGILEEENLLWRLGDTLIALGTGSSITLNPGDLPVGTSEIRLIATNASGKTASASSFITLHDDLPRPHVGRWPHYLELARSPRHPHSANRPPDRHQPRSGHAYLGGHYRRPVDNSLCHQRRGPGYLHRHRRPRRNGRWRVCMQKMSVAP
jgi:hypothetical protein